MNVLNSLDSTGAYFNQILSLSATPTNSFSVSGWTTLIDLIMSLLTNPFFYAIIGIIVILGILPTVEDE